jgi:hypothetical protein
MVALVGLVVWMTASVSGCSAAALAYTGHKISEAQKESAAQHNEAMSEMAYSNYCYQMENLNLKREKEGLKPRPIMSKQEWLATKRIAPPPAEVKKEEAKTAAPEAQAGKEEEKK